MPVAECDIPTLNRDLSYFAEVNPVTGIVDQEYLVARYGVADGDRRPSYSSFLVDELLGADADFSTS